METIEELHKGALVIKEAEGTLALARTLDVLEPLILRTIEEGKYSARQSVDFYCETGQLLREAKPQVERKQWKQYVRNKFGISARTAGDWMYAARIKYGEQEVLLMLTDSDARLAADLQPTEYKTLSEITQPERDPSHKPKWHRPVHKIVNKLNVKRLRQQYEDELKEKRLLFGVAKHVIDLGYKVLATKLHPDKGGSAEAMYRLNHVRKTLKEFAEETWSK